MKEVSYASTSFIISEVEREAAISQAEKILYSKPSLKESTSSLLLSVAEKLTDKLLDNLARKIEESRRYNPRVIEEIVTSGIGYSMVAGLVTGGYFLKSLLG